MTKAIIRKLGFNPAVFYSLIQKFWQSAVGLTGMLLVSHFYSPELQGFYYAFLSLVTLQTFFELSLYLIIGNIASHEWAGLQLTGSGRIVGNDHNLSRLCSLGRFAFKWYGIVTLLYLLFVGLGGWLFLNYNSELAAAFWQGPWIIHILFSSALLWAMPFLSLLEGCGQVTEVAKFRLWQVTLSGLGFCIAIFLGAELWALAIMSGISMCCIAWYLMVARKPFFDLFLVCPRGLPINWRDEILPMQWRMALQGVLHYFVFGLCTPVIFFYHGAVFAGQVGMTLHLLGSVQALASVWLVANTPRLALLVAQNDTKLFESEWKASTMRGAIAMCVGGCLVTAVLIVANAHQFEFATRMTSVGATALFFAGGFFSLLCASFAIYIRVHKIELMLPATLISAGFMSVLVWELGRHYGVLGVSIAYAFVFCFIFWPLTFLIWRKARVKRYVLPASAKN